jgi:hypothetical protein
VEVSLLRERFVGRDFDGYEDEKDESAPSFSDKDN